MANAWIIKPLPVAVATGSTTAGAVANLTNDYAGVIWQSDGFSFYDVIVDLGSDKLIDTIALFGVDLAPGTATMQVFASTEATGSSFQAPTWAENPIPLYAGSAKLSSGKGVSLWSAASNFPPAIRFLLLRFASDQPTFALRLSRLVVGKRIELSRNFTFGAAFGVKDLGSVDFSRLGVILRKRGAKLRTAGLTFSSIYRDEVEAIVQPLLEQVGNTETVAIITDPSPDPMRQRRCYFGPLVGDLGFTWRKANAFEAKTNIVSIF